MEIEVSWLTFPCLSFLYYPMDCDMKDNMLIWVDNWSKQYDPIDIVKWAAKRTQSKRDIRTTREARLED